jgi:hypothetical protein
MTPWRARADVGFENANANPGPQEFLVAVRAWFRDYKKPDGKPENKFGYDDHYLSNKKGVEIVEQQHQLWVRLVQQAPETVKADSTSSAAEFWWQQRPDAK